MKERRIPDFVWRLMKILNKVPVRTYQDGARTGNLVLLLTTTGRKSGQPRLTPLQYEEQDGVYYVASARGEDADWFRNIIAEPHIQVQVKDQHFAARAEPITNPERFADFLELRLERRPRMMRAMLRAEGLPANFTRSDLEHFSINKAMIAIYPEERGIE